MNAAEISAIAALAGVALGQLLARSGEYRKWLRAERHKAAAELLAAGEAMRRHSATRIGDLYATGTVRDGASDEYLAILERLALALEAARTVFPPPVAALAERLENAAHGLAFVPGKKKEQAQGPTPGDMYASARAEFTGAARRLITPAPGSQARATLAYMRVTKQAAARLKAYPRLPLLWLRRSAK